ITWTLWVPSPQFQVTDPPGATVTSAGPKALLAMVTSAAFAVAGRRMRAPAARAATATWRKDMAAKLGRRRWEPPSSIRRRTLAAGRLRSDVERAVRRLAAAGDRGDLQDAAAGDQAPRAARRVDLHEPALAGRDLKR